MDRQTADRRQTDRQAEARRTEEQTDGISYSARYVYTRKVRPQCFLLFPPFKNVVSWKTTRRTLSQFWCFKIRRTTFLKYIKFLDLLMLRLENCERVRRVLVSVCFSFCLAPKFLWVFSDKMRNEHPDLPFHCFELQSQPHDVSEQHKTRRSPDLEAKK